MPRIRVQVKVIWSIGYNCIDDSDLSMPWMTLSPRAKKLLTRRIPGPGFSEQIFIFQVVIQKGTTCRRPWARWAAWCRSRWSRGWRCGRQVDLFTVNALDDFVPKGKEVTNPKDTWTRIFRSDIHFSGCTAKTQVPFRFMIQHFMQILTYKRCLSSSSRLWVFWVTPF